MIQWVSPEDRQASKGVQWWEKDSRPGGSQRTVARSVLRSVAIAFLTTLCLSLGTATAAGYLAKDPVLIRSLRGVWSDVLQAVVGEGSEPAVDSGSHPLNALTGEEQKTPREGEASLGVSRHDENGSGRSEEAPGHDEDGPGRSEEAPGHDEDGPGSRRKP